MPLGANEKLGEVIPGAVTDNDGRLVVVPTTTPGYPAGAATEATLAQVRDAVDQLEGFLDGVEALLTTIRDNADMVEPKLDALVEADFKRLLKFEPKAGEEIRRDEQTNDDYHGAAPDGTLTSALSWKVVRFYKTGGLITRVRYRTGVAWDDRTLGW